MKIVRHLPALLLGVSLAVPVLAAPSGAPPSGAPPAGGPPADRPCHADAMKYCGDHVGDRETMRTCMREHYASFSEQCRNAIQARQQARQGQGPAGQGQQQNGAAGSAPAEDDS